MRRIYIYIFVCTSFLCKNILAVASEHELNVSDKTVAADTLRTYKMEEVVITGSS